MLAKLWRKLTGKASKKIDIVIQNSPYALGDRHTVHVHGKEDRHFEIVPEPAAKKPANSVKKKSAKKAAPKRKATRRKK